MSSTSLPAGYSPPSTLVTATDHSGWITVAAALGLCVVLLFYAIKLYIRTEFSLPFRRDDAVLTVATAFFVAQASVTLAQVASGFGRTIESISFSSLVEVQKLSYASEILYIFDLFLSKWVVILFCIRLTPDKLHNRLLQALAAFSMLWAFVSILIVALRCNLSHPWIQYNVRCTGLYTRWQFVAALDIVIEACLFVASVLLVRDLQMAFKKKMTVVTVFAFRLPVIALAVLRLRYIRVGLLSANPTLLGVPAVVFTEVELSYSIISAIIPCLNPFMKALSTHYGAMGPNTVIGGTQLSGSRTNKSGMNKSDSYDLRAMKSAENEVEIPQRASVAHKKTASDLPEIDPQVYRGDNAKSVAEAVSSSGRLDSESVGSDDSTKRMIKMKFEWSVASEASSHGEAGH